VAIGFDFGISSETVRELERTSIFDVVSSGAFNTESVRVPVAADKRKKPVRAVLKIPDIAMHGYQFNLNRARTL
jgi:hypothetical protein